MAKRRGGGRRGGKGYYGQYKFTTRRKAALRRAQAISARKRKGSKLATAAKVGGILGTVAAAGYLGHRYGGTVSTAASSAWKKQFAPKKMEDNKVANQPANRSRTLPGIAKTQRINPKTMEPYSITEVPQIDNDAINAIRGKLIADKLGPQLGGPDHRIYDDEGNVDTEAMTKRSVARTTRKGKGKTSRKTGRTTATTSATQAGVLGKKTRSLRGTPGGTRTYSPGDPSNKMSDAEMEAAFSMNTGVTYQPVIPRRTNKSLSGGPNALATKANEVIGKHAPKSSTGAVTQPPVASPAAKRVAANKPRKVSKAEAQADSAAARAMINAQANKDAKPKESDSPPKSPNLENVYPLFSHAKGRPRPVLDNDKD